ncbi:aspartyl/asparaginyl beta-hydroxylase domain-containing protein [Phenylobacterium sp.]|uniref:aspartyl/asparaginyl beta-hydroxylase domain-containing protein n=1 Tax=Phenylobacterium sp. TaxID=1871053 RepID=UPI003982F336
MSEGAPAAADLLARSGEALARGDRAEALALIAQAQAADAADPALRLQKALIHRTGREWAQALAALDEALALDPYNFLALLSKGAVVERMSGSRAAAKVYENALKLAPTPENLPANLAAPTARAHQVVAGVQAELEAYLRHRVGAMEAAGGAAAQARFDEALGVYAGTRRVYVQQPLLLHYPRLPAIPFHERALFPWLAELEASSDVIRGELEGVLALGQADFAPYIAFPPEAPVNQWGELNHSARWSSYFLWKDGERQSDACARCPRTAALLEGLPMARLPGFAPTAMFSALDAHTAIPPHTGSTNTRLIVHLPLVLPGPARFRVGGETQAWRMGEAWVFDDTMEHEAWNDADQTRIILIFDVWNPLLEPGERDLVAALMTARNDFYAG